MTFLELLERIRRGENLHTEFKAAEVHPDEIAAGLVAFANTDGGQLIFGVSDDGRIIGVDDPDRLAQQVDQIAYNNCEPPITVVQETVRDQEGRTVLVVNVPKGDQRPYQTKRQGHFFIRTSSGRRRASRQELLRLFQAAESLYYDEVAVRRAGLGDLDLSHFGRFFEQAYAGQPMPDEANLPIVLRNLGLLADDNGRLVPTVAGLLCFGREPQRYLPAAQVIAARIPGTELAGEPSDVKPIGGSLFTTLEETMRFLNIHLPIAHRIRGLQPEPDPVLPIESLRELLVNALVHRDYTLTAPTRVLLFDNRLEIRSPGRLPNAVTEAALLQGAAHVLRNPKLYLIFYSAGLVTHLGSGVRRAKAAIERTGRATLALEQTETEFVVRIIFTLQLFS
ncbi:MAG: putative DNA binding domain-containing protein [Thermoflexales bacterium]|nr:putative DNA binding domain-containing protein [Thermoflexales bacterium]